MAGLRVGASVRSFFASFNARTTPASTLQRFRAPTGGHPRILTRPNHTRQGWLDVRFAQKTTKLLRGSVTLSAKALNRCAIARGGGRGAHQYGSTRGEMVSSVWVIVS